MIAVQPGGVKLALADLTAADAVLRALDEFDEIGRDQFLSKYGFGTARSYFLVRDGRAYEQLVMALLLSLL